mgnify:CR=1 FL=1
MENRYLFRAKRIDNDEWVYGLPSYNKDGEIAEIEEWDGEDIIFYTVDPSTICQCTGLRDKNDKLIWENDIVNCLNEECYGYIGWNESEAGFYFNALFEDGKFEEEHIYDYQDCIEVIGNVFDNPELLEV